MMMMTRTTTPTKTTTTTIDQSNQLQRPHSRCDTCAAQARFFKALESAQSRRIKAPSPLVSWRHLRGEILIRGWRLDGAKIDPISASAARRRQPRAGRRRNLLLAEPISGARSPAASGRRAPPRTRNSSPVQRQQGTPSAQEKMTSVVCLSGALLLCPRRPFSRRLLIQESCQR